jgi:hypothetical protein
MSAAMRLYASRRACSLVGPIVEPRLHSPALSIEGHGPLRYLPAPADVHGTFSIVPSVIFRLLPLTA